MKSLLVSSALFSAAMFLTPAVMADTPQLYKWTDAQGVVHYSDQPPKQPAADLQTSDLPAFPAVDQGKVDEEQAALLAQALALQQLAQAQALALAAARAAAGGSAEVQPAAVLSDDSYSPAPIYMDSAFVPRAYRANLYVSHRVPHVSPLPVRPHPSRPAIPLLQRP
jgi:hypothetical protein